jgi:dTMP kinase
MSGKLIVFEGGEGSGKTTQIKRLHEYLTQSEGLKLLQTENRVRGIKLTREPGGTALGKQIRHLLLHYQPDLADESVTPMPIVSKAELLLYAADRAQHVEEVLLPWLKQGYWVLCDRYTDSTVAYQGYGRQLDLALIHQLNQIATSQLKSDLTFWLKVPPAVGLARMHQRGQADRIEQASGLFHQRVSEGFAALAANSQAAEEAADKMAGGDCADENLYGSGPTVEVDGDRPASVVAAEIQQIFQRRLGEWYPPPLL